MNDLTTMHEIVGESGEQTGEGCGMVAVLASLLAIVGSFSMFYVVLKVVSSWV